ncbi:MAG: hypothetical protein M3N53_02865 [Actinomycetota bacterium]|nr:hypothetical protein [Actinomycetota bacterium]
MADNAEPEYVEQVQRNEALEAKIEKLAQKLLRESDDNGQATDGSLEAARRAARRILEDSEARVAEGYDLEPDDDHVIRRSSAETATSGDTGGTRWVSDGE